MQSRQRRRRSPLARPPTCSRPGSRTRSLLPGAARRRGRDRGRAAGASHRTSTTRTSTSTPGRPTRTRTATRSSAAPYRASIATSTSRAAGSTPVTSSSSPTRRRTASGCCIAAQRELGAAAPADLGAEARFGQDWLDTRLGSGRQVMYLQVGIGSGNRQARSTATTTCGGSPRATTRSPAAPTDTCASAPRSAPTTRGDGCRRTWPGAWPRPSHSRRRSMRPATPCVPARARHGRADLTPRRRRPR